MVVNGPAFGDEGRVAADPAGRSLAARVAERFKSPSDFFLAARIMGWACVMPVLKQLIALQNLVRLVRRTGRNATRDSFREDQIVTFARWACRLTRWSSGGNCLERGLIAYRYLGAINAQPTLVVGIGRGDNGGVRGHAWILLDGRPVGESQSALRQYETVMQFGPDGLRQSEPQRTSA
jgi:hypothetical protein